MGNHGILTISLDFELYWGIRDKKTLSSYRQNLFGVRKAIPLILELFQRYNIHASWATVGFLFFHSKEQLLKSLPLCKPRYLNSNLSPYEYLLTIGEDEQTDPYHYAPSMISLIRSYPFQWIGTHTFSHYYCREQGQDIESFRADLEAAISIASKQQIRMESIVFPRNQSNAMYLSVCKELGINVYRGNESAWIYHAGQYSNDSILKRAFRLLDAYINFSGHHTSGLDTQEGNLPWNIPSSRFLRPYHPKLRLLEPLRLNRITSGLTYAAKHGQIYHLWWHPHNFGVHLPENLSFLEKILQHYQNLHNIYGMKSMSMEEAADHLSRRAVK